MRLGRWFKPDEKRLAAVEQVKSFVLKVLPLAEGKTISVSEIECGDPTCPGGVETAVLVRGKASVEAAFKLRGPIDTLTLPKVEEAVAAWQRERQARS